MVVKRCKLNTPCLTFGKYVSPSKICPKLTLLSSITAFPVQGAHMLSRNQIVAGLVICIILCNHCRNSLIQSNAGIMIVICTLYFDLFFFFLSATSVTSVVNTVPILRSTCQPRLTFITTFQILPK